MSTSAENDFREVSEHHVTPMGVIFTILMISVLIGGGITGAVFFVKTKPEVQRKKATVSAPLVRVVPAVLSEETVIVEALGTVQGSETVSLKSRIAGEVKQISPVFDPGGHFEKGDVILTLDKSDYELALTQQKSSLAQAESAFAVEKGRYAVAEKDVELIGSKLTPEEELLAKREPQLQAAGAAVEAARAGVLKAELDLDRTEIKAPFSCVVEKRYVSPGDIVGSATPLAELKGTAVYRIEATLPVDQLKWIDVPRGGKGKGADATIKYPAAWGTDLYRVGRVESLSPSLTTAGQMAKLYVSVNDPLSLKPENSEKPVLSIGAYVQLHIQGMKLKNIISVPRYAVHDGNTVWIAKKDETLEIRKITTMWVDRETAFISEGIAEGEQIIMSDLAAPIGGMKIHSVTESGKELTGPTPEQEPAQMDAGMENSEESGKEPSDD